ncbi:MAG: hypothetical protein HWE39_00915 [Oceanospirillaceae bacterium]|nr:hypothetical protein [Oceanospirillaceae bacterium]
MNQPVNELIDPSLQDAVEHWSDYAKDSLQTAEVVLRLYTPVKDSLQITQQVLESVQENDWTPSATLPDAATFSGIVSELSDIQVAALKRMSDDFNRYLDTSVEAGKLFGETLKTDGDPQQQLAAWLETSLKVTKAYQDDFSQQLSDLGAIESAYKAWWQKSLESLLG